MYGNLYAGKTGKRTKKSENGFTKALIFCAIAGLLFLTGYENYRIMQRISTEIQESELLGEVGKSAAEGITGNTEEANEKIIGDKKERKIRIVLDAGHGGRDTGSLYEGICEKDINYEIVRDLQKLLEDMGVEVILSRNEDVFITEYERIKEANNKKADLFISIHCDCNRDGAGEGGLECLYAKEGYLGMEYADALMAAIKQRSEIKCNGVGNGNFYVLKNANMPAIFIKLGSLSNWEDRRKLTEANYRQQTVKVLAQSIMQLFHN